MKRALAIALTVLIAVGLFILAGTRWVTNIDLSAALERYRALPSSVRGPGTGVYRYRTDGVETVSLFNYSRRYSPETMRLVSRRGCGVREEQWFLVQHLEYYDRCGDQLVGYGTDIAYWWTHGTQDFRCQGGSFDGRGMRPGETSRWHCADEDTEAKQSTEYLGDETITVAGSAVRARHTRWITDFSGATVGRAVVDDWFGVDNHVVLREERRMGMNVGSPFVGRLDYTDVSTYQLASLDPVQ